MRITDLLKKEDIDRLYSMTGDIDILVLNASVQYKRKWNEFIELRRKKHAF